jgi:hypothetical protein
VSTSCQTSDFPSGMCGYNVTYADETKVSGYYVSDTMYFDTTIGNRRSANYSSTVVFG